MPVIAMFYGLIVSMYFIATGNTAHVKYQDEEAVFRIPDGELLSGSIPRAKMKLVYAWIELHQDELMANWQLAVSGQQPYKIEPLK